MTTYVTDKDTGKLVTKQEWEAKHGPWPRRTERPKNSAMYGDRHYENQVLYGAQNGKPTVINSRKQHRQFMKDNNLTTIDDFNGKGGSWEKSAQARADNLAGKDSSRKSDVVEAAKQHGAI